MANLSKLASEVFEILQSYDYTVMLYDEDGARLTDEPADARQFIDRQQNLMVSIKDDGENSTLVLTIGKTTQINDVLGLDQALRTCATKYLLTFQVRRAGQDIQPKDGAPPAVAESATKALPMNVFEGMYGTSRSSYLRLEHARMIVRHSAKIDETKIGARGRCIESILIENEDGERFRFPTCNLAPARAMTQHVNHGGSQRDPIGEQIVRLAEDYANLGRVSAHVFAHAQTLDEGAGCLRRACRRKMHEMRNVCERLYRPGGYVTESQALLERGTMLNETEAVTPERIEEVRRLLAVEGRDLDGAVLETVCKSLSAEEIDEAKQNLGRAPKERGEDLSYEKTAVLGRAVRKSAWDAFADRDAPTLDLTPGFDPAQIGQETRRTAGLPAELEFKLGALLPFVADNTMANLFSHVIDKLPDAKPGTPLFNHLSAVAKRALRLAGVAVGPKLASNAPAVREFNEWLDRFRTERVLEAGYSMANDPYRDESDADYAEDRAIQDFDPEEFLHSSIGEDLSSHDEAEVRSALHTFLIHWMETHTGHLALDASHLVAALLPQTMEALAQQSAPGRFDANDEEGPSTGEPMMAEEGVELTPEDVLLPSEDEGLDLAREVTAATVRDPVDGHEEEPDASYVSRLTTLAGLRGARPAF